ncbi:phosphatidylinositol N-acetylglucosaminyltransferase subunit H-like [Battus philenor]|uniref:phosphatidylinositol N-acetylglucosaminyltransferase subunit H-like n=1 Tax=Battus philenor TaxID=42288 RepID=UPI0035CEAC5A
MGKSEKVLDYDNVNGVHLSLKMERLKNSTNSMSFTISFKNKEQKSQWPKISLAFAIIFNILALVYIRISVTAILIIFIVLSFLVFFWITHSVQSESVVVIPTVGIQNSIKYVFGREDIFVAWANIDDVIIHEVIKLNRVLYFLTLLVKNSASQSSQESDGIKLIPLFKYTKPRLVMLEAIYTELQSLLMTARRRDDELASGDIE